MKNTLFKYLLIFSLLLFISYGNAQEEEKMPTMYSIHVDHVKPSMHLEYEGIAKEFVAFLKEHQVEDFNYFASASEDFKYSYISTVDKMADFDRNPMSQISDEAELKKFGDILDRMDKCYSKHGNYMIYLDTTLTYMPGGFSATTPGQPYRVYYLHHYEPSESKNIYAAAKAIKTLFEKNQAKMEYRMYHSGFGVVGSYLLIAVSAKNEGDLYEKSKANWELMGEEFKNAIDNMMEHTSSFEVQRAWIRDDLSYQKEE